MEYGEHVRRDSVDGMGLALCCGKEETGVRRLALMLLCWDKEERIHLSPSVQADCHLF